MSYETPMKLHYKIWENIHDSWKIFDDIRARVCVSILLHELCVWDQKTTGSYCQFSLSIRSGFFFSKLSREARQKGEAMKNDKRKQKMMIVAGAKK